MVIQKAKETAKQWVPSGQRRPQDRQGRKSRLLLLLFLGAVLFAVASARDLRAQGQAGARNIIFMVADGLGLADVTAARIFKNGSDGASLALESLPRLGYQRTHSANSTLTDSAAAATAWATGNKSANGQISCLDGRHCSSEALPTILEIAARRGKATGLLTTVAITDATVAAFAAHVHSRSCQLEIARQYIEGNKVDVLLGGGIGEDHRRRCQTPSPVPIDSLLQRAVAAWGYTRVGTLEQLQRAVAAGAGKILGLFGTGDKTPELFRLRGGGYPATEPTLAQMTSAALEVLGRNDSGFFLVVEGGRVDRANHRHDLEYQVAETLGFDAAVEVVLAWLREARQRGQETLLIITADHECGGFAIVGPRDRVPGRGELVEPGWGARGHSGVDTMIWSQGPGSEQLNRGLDNTELFEVMRAVMD